MKRCDLCGRELGDPNPLVGWAKRIMKVDDACQKCVNRVEKALSRFRSRIDKIKDSRESQIVKFVANSIRSKARAG